MLENWFAERRQGVDESADITRTNGSLTNQKWRILVYLQVVIGTILLQIPWLLNKVTKSIFRDDLGYKGAKAGFFLPEHGGGGKLAQIFVQRNSKGKPLRSDNILCRSRPLITILVISSGKETRNNVAAVRGRVQKIGLDHLILSDESICLFDPNNDSEEEDVPRYTPCNVRGLN